MGEDDVSIGVMVPGDPLPNTPADPFSVAFTQELDHGTVVGVFLPDDGGPKPTDTAELPFSASAFELLPFAEERAFARTLGRLRVAAWIGGRLALHHACELIHAHPGAILATERGGPLLPAGLTGSISHKRRIAVAIVARTEGATIGIDIEELGPRRYDVAKVILTSREAEEISSLAEPDRTREILTRFSVKEAIYKAIDPFVGRYVDFKEVEVTPDVDGTTTIVANLVKGEGPFILEGSWRVREGYVLTTARARVGLRSPRQVVIESA